MCGAIRLLPDTLIHLQRMERDNKCIYIYIYIYRRQNNLVGIVIKLRDRQKQKGGLIVGKGRRFFLFQMVQSVSGVNPVSCLGLLKALSLTVSDRDNLITRCHLVSRLRTSGPMYSKVLFRNCSTAIELTFVYL